MIKDYTTSLPKQTWYWRVVGQWWPVSSLPRLKNYVSIQCLNVACCCRTMELSLSRHARRHKNDDLKSKLLMFLLILTLSFVVVVLCLFIMTYWIGNHSIVGMWNGFQGSAKLFWWLAMILFQLKSNLKQSKAVVMWAHSTHTTTYQHAVARIEDMAIVEIMFVVLLCFDLFLPNNLVFGHCIGNIIVNAAYIHYYY